MATAFFLALATCAWGQNTPKGFLVPADTHSPDHRFGVTVPILDELKDSDDAKNSVVELKTGRVLSEIRAETGWNRMNHGGVLPTRWSKDGSLLVWEVDGKWFPWALVAMKIEKGAVQWQTDILKAAQQALLARTKKAAPRKYAAAKEANRGNGSAYPEGFSIDVEAMDPVSLPLRIRATLTSNPKQLDIPNLDSRLEGIVDLQGRFVVTSFELKRGHSRHF